MILDPHSFIPIAKAAEQISAASPSPVSVLGLNAKLFIAQLINFAVVLFVLWKWVFTPVAKKLQERTEKIEKSLQDSERIAKEKREFENWRNEELAKARQTAAEIINASQTEAEKAKDKILMQTKTQQAQILTQTKEQIELEKQKALGEAKASLADLVTAAAEKILRKKLDAPADEKLIKESLQQLK